MGKLRRAPRQEWKAKFPPGVIRSETEPTETRGLSRRYGNSSYAIHYSLMLKQILK